MVLDCSDSCAQAARAKFASVVSKSKRKKNEIKGELLFDDVVLRLGSGVSFRFGGEFAGYFCGAAAATMGSRRASGVHCFRPHGEPTMTCRLPRRVCPVVFSTGCNRGRGCSTEAWMLESPRIMDFRVECLSWFSETTQSCNGLNGMQRSAVLACMR